MDPFDFHYKDFPRIPQFRTELMLAHGISEDVYERVRVAYAKTKPSFETTQYAGQKGFLPAILTLSIIGIPFLGLLSGRAGVLSRRPTNAAILAFRAAATGDPAYMRFFDGDLHSIPTDLIQSVF